MWNNPDGVSGLCFSLFQLCFHCLRWCRFSSPRSNRALRQWHYNSFSLSRKIQFKTVRMSKWFTDILSKEHYSLLVKRRTDEYTINNINSVMQFKDGHYFYKWGFFYTELCQVCFLSWPQRHKMSKSQDEEVLSVATRWYNVCMQRVCTRWQQHWSQINNMTVCFSFIILIMFMGSNKDLNEPNNSNTVCF